MTMAVTSSMTRTPLASMARTWPIDPVATSVALSIVVIGLIMVASASSAVSDRMFGSPFSMLIRHLAYLAIALGASAFVLMVPMSIWRRLDWMLLLVAFVLLLAVLVPGIGKEVNGSTRWIDLGAFSLQGSEFVKFFVVVYLAGYLVRHKEDVTQNFVAFVKPLLIVLGMVALLLQQPDFGAAVVIMSATMGLVFLAGVPLRYFVPMAALGGVATAFVVLWAPYRVERLTTFANPWEHQFTGGYQLTQALIAFGRGEWFGLGLGNSIQKLFFLPEAHNDFLFSIIAEELGVFGAITVILLFAVLVLRGIWIGRMAENRGLDFHAYIAFGASLILGVQAAVNIGVNIGALPTKGLTLPLMSYGGNSLIISCALVAILLRVEYECRNEEAGKGKRRRGGSRRGI